MCLFSEPRTKAGICDARGLSYKKVSFKRPKVSAVRSVLYSFDRFNGRNGRNFRSFETNFLIGETSGVNEVEICVFLPTVGGRSAIFHQTKHKKSQPCPEHTFLCFPTDWGYETSSRKWNIGRNGLHQLGLPVATSILFPGRRFISPVCTFGFLLSEYESFSTENGITLDIA